MQSGFRITASAVALSLCAASALAVSPRFDNVPVDPPFTGEALRAGNGASGVLLFGPQEAPTDFIEVVGVGQDISFADSNTINPSLLVRSDTDGGLASATGRPFQDASLTASASAAIAPVGAGPRTLTSKAFLDLSAQVLTSPAVSAVNQLFSEGWYLGQSINGTTETEIALRIVLDQPALLRLPPNFSALETEWNMVFETRSNDTGTINPSPFSNYDFQLEPGTYTLTAEKSLSISIPLAGSPSVDPDASFDARFVFSDIPAPSTALPIAIGALLVNRRRR